jgi:type II secretory pathway pseudopilin PulG
MQFAAPTMPLPEAPGAKAARICGILAIVFAVTCICFPVGVVLGIVALVKHSGAKKCAQEQPESYAQPSQSGLITGIVGLVLALLFALPGIGIVSAIAIPALLGQRARARDKAAISTLQSKLPELAERYGRSLETGAAPMSIKTELDNYLQSSGDLAKNPYNPQAPAFRFTVGMTSAANEADVSEAARSQAGALGEVVFVMSVPLDPQGPRFVAGAVRTQTPVDGNRVFAKVMPVD